MNNKQLYQLYLESFWNVLQENNISLRKANQWYTKIIIYQTKDYNKIKDYLERHYKTQGEIVSLDELKEYVQANELHNFKKNISSATKLIVKNHMIDDEKEAIDKLNEQIITRFFSQVPGECFSSIYDKIADLFLTPCSSYQVFWKIIRHLNEKYGKKEATQLFYQLPISWCSFHKSNHLQEEITNYINDINQFFGKESHQCIYNFVKARAKQANASQVGSVALREALISEYVGKNDLLDSYKDIVPSLKKYLETTEEGEFYFQPKTHIIHKTIDIEQLKAVASINISQNKDYLELIKVFLHQYKQKDKRIVSFDSTMSRIKNDHVYLSFFIYCKPDNFLPEQEFDKKLRSFIKMLGQEKPDSVIKVRNMIDTWWMADNLTAALDNQDNVIKKKNKI